MDAVEFIKEKNRMCKNIKCSECDLSSNNTNLNPACDIFIWKHPVEAVKIVEQWSKEHPEPTRQNKFLKTFPDAILLDGMLNICPSDVFGWDCKKYALTTDGDCNDCRRRFWLTPIEEEDE